MSFVSRHATSEVGLRQMAASPFSWTTVCLRFALAGPFLPVPARGGGGGSHNRPLASINPSLCHLLPHSSQRHLSAFTTGLHPRIIDRRLGDHKSLLVYDFPARYVRHTGAEGEGGGGGRL